MNTYPVHGFSVSRVFFNKNMYTYRLRLEFGKGGHMKSSKGRILSKRVLSFLLILSVTGLTFCFSGSNMAMAGTTHTLKKNLYVGEKFILKPVVASNTFKSVKTSNKKVVTVKKNSKKKITITAKKKGKATITVKTKQNITYKYKITVIKKSTEWKAFTPYNLLDSDTNLYSSYVMFEIKNTSGVFANSCEAYYSLYSASGDVISTGSYIPENLPSGKSVHFFAAASSLKEKVKKGVITKLKLIQDENASKYKYTDRSSAVKITEISMDDYSIKLNIKNTLSEAVQGVGEVVYYRDKDYKYPIGMSTINLYTNANGSNTVSVAPIPGMVNYKIFKRAYTSKYVG